MMMMMILHRLTTIYAGAPKTVTDKLQRVLNAAARVVSDTRKFDRGLSTLLHDELHWLDVPERVTLGLMTYRCLHGQAPRYLADHITPRSRISTLATFRFYSRLGGLVSNSPEIKFWKLLRQCSSESLL